jgi:hypothetical protein
MALTLWIDRREASAANRSRAIDVSFGHMIVEAKS